MLLTTIKSARDQPNKLGVQMKEKMSYDAGQKSIFNYNIWSYRSTLQETGAPWKVRQASGFRIRN